MLLAKDVHAEIKNYEQRRSELEKTMKEKEYKQLCKRVDLMRSCAYYLDQDPRPEFVQKMLDDLQQKKESLLAGFDIWKKNQIGSCNDWMAKFRTEMGFTAMNAQIKTLNYILNN